MDERYDVVVIGGGAAGLNGALMLARSRRSVLVVDAGAPRNAPASGVHGLLGREGTPPSELLATGRAEVALDPIMNIWDCAALLPIVEEAGGRFTDWSGRRTIDGGEAVATNGFLHGDVLDLLREPS